MNETKATKKSDANETTIGQRLLRDGMKWFGPLIGLVLVTFLFAGLDMIDGHTTFFQLDNFQSVALRTCMIAVAALGMTFIIIGGGIDLSAGTALTLSATTLAWALHGDIGFRVTHGGSVSSVSESLSESLSRMREAEAVLRREHASHPAVARLLSAIEKHDNFQVLAPKLSGITGSSDAPKDLPAWDVYSYWLAESFQIREQLNEMLRAKHATVATSEDAAAIERKLQQLLSTTFDPKREREWLRHIPNSPLTAPLAVLIGIGTGFLAGLVNGLLISRLRVVPFIVTLGTMTMFVGIGNVICGNTPIRPGRDDQIPQAMQDLLASTKSAQWFGLFPAGVWLTLLLALISFFVLRYTVFGRHVFALGSNESTARLCGISVPRTKIMLYSLAGIFFGIAGVCQFARTSIGDPTSGLGLELRIIAAVVIGGGSLNGGRGSILGTFAGAAIMEVINSGCTHLELALGHRQLILGRNHCCGRCHRSRSTTRRISATSDACAVFRRPKR